MSAVFLYAIRFNTQPPEGGWMSKSIQWLKYAFVSTHSRLKAAGRRHVCLDYLPQGFNTQPPEGGWIRVMMRQYGAWGFNTQPPEGGWSVATSESWKDQSVSTHSRLKAAGCLFGLGGFLQTVSTHSRLKAAGRRQKCWVRNGIRFQHTAA